MGPTLVGDRLCELLAEADVAIRCRGQGRNTRATRSDAASGKFDPGVRLGPNCDRTGASFFSGKQGEMR
jgi:hypothetical protein